MNPFEVERLGWYEFKGLPIVGDENMQTGRVRVVCAGEETDDEMIDAVAEEHAVA